MSALRPVEYTNDQFVRHVVEATQLDIARDDSLLVALKVLGHKGEPLNAISTVAPNQMRVSAPGDWNDPVGLILNVAEFNVDLMSCILLGGYDLNADDRLKGLMGSRMQRLGIDKASVDGMLSLLDLCGIPDVGKSVAGNTSSFRRVLSARNSRAALEFRQRVRTAGVKDARDLERLYVSLVDDELSGQNFGQRVIRFAIFSLVGMAGPLVDLAADAVDSLLLDRLLHANAPRVFLSRLRNATRDQ